MKSTGQSELRAAIEELKGIKPAQIADIISRRRIKGRPGTTGRCPLALMFQNTHGGRFIVGQKYVMRQVGANVEKIKTPENLAAFVRMFDEGRYQDLIQVPPRCIRKNAPGPKRSGPSGKHIARKPVAERLHLARDAQRFTAR